MQVLATKAHGRGKGDFVMTRQKCGNKDCQLRTDISLVPLKDNGRELCFAAEEAVSHISRGYFYKCRIAKSSNLPRSG
jgi:hypothetical protein